MIRRRCYIHVRIRYKCYTHVRIRYKCYIHVRISYKCYVQVRIRYLGGAFDDAASTVVLHIALRLPHQKPRVRDLEVLRPTILVKNTLLLGLRRAKETNKEKRKGE